MSRIRDIAIIFIVMTGMTWLFLHYLDVELDIRERQNKTHFMEGKIR